MRAVAFTGLRPAAEKTKDLWSSPLTEPSVGG